MIRTGERVHRGRNPVPPLLILIALTALAGCAKPTSSVAPTASAEVAAGGARAARASTAANAGFYPLAIGNRWHYQRTFTLSGGGELEVFPSEISREQVCVEPYGGHDYLVERLVEVTPEGNSYRSWILNRQDPSGLYEADGVSLPQGPSCDPAPPRSLAGTAAAGRAAPRGPLVESAAIQTRLSAIGDPVRCAATLAAWKRLEARIARVREKLPVVADAPEGGPQPGEITRLRYPLHVGADWLIRDDPDFELPSRVTALDMLRLPIGNVPAWRIRIEWPLIDPQREYVHTWYSQRGFMGLKFHLIVEVTDQNGNPIGELAADETQWCDDLSLVGSDAEDVAAR